MAARGLSAPLLAALLLLAAACTKSGSEPASGPAPGPGGSGAPPATDAGPVPAAHTAAEYALDGMKVGASFAPFVARAPYSTPCDDDAVDKPKTRRALVYAARPCHGTTFPEDTTLVVTVDWVEPDDFKQPIRAIAWLGGPYFESRGNFPLKVGESKARAVATFGEPVASFEISDKKQPLVVWSFAGEIHALLDGDALAGFVLGPMPRDPEAGDWEVIQEMYREATPKVGKGAGDGAVSREDCDKVLKHVDVLLGQEKPRDPGKHEGEIDECVAEATPAMIQCALAAKTMDEVQACTAD